MKKLQETDITGIMMLYICSPWTSQARKKETNKTEYAHTGMPLHATAPLKITKAEDRETQSQVVGHHIFQHVRNWNVRNINRRQLEEWLPFAYMANIREMSIVWHIPPNMKPEDRLLIFTRRKDQENQQHIDGRTNETTLTTQQKRLL